MIRRPQFKPHEEPAEPAEAQDAAPARDEAAFDRTTDLVADLISLFGYPDDAESYRSRRASGGDEFIVSESTTPEELMRAIPRRIRERQLLEVRETLANAAELSGADELREVYWSLEASERELADVLEREDAELDGRSSVGLVE